MGVYRLTFDMDIRENMEHNLEPELLRDYQNMEAGFALLSRKNDVVTKEIVQVIETASLDIVRS